MFDDGGTMAATLMVQQGCEGKHCSFSSGEYCAVQGFDRVEWNRFFLSTLFPKHVQSCLLPYEGCVQGMCGVGQMLLL